MFTLLYSQGNLDWILRYTTATPLEELKNFLHWGVFKNSLDNNLPVKGRLDPSSLYEEEHDGPFYML